VDVRDTGIGDENRSGRLAPVTGRVGSVFQPVLIRKIGKFQFQNKVFVGCKRLMD